MTRTFTYGNVTVTKEVSRDTVLLPVLCYRVKATGEEFLAGYMLSFEQAVKLAEDYNTNKPERIWNDQPAKCDEREYFADVQPEMY